MRYELLGPLQLVDERTHTVNAPKVETLLAALLIRANQPVSTDELIDELWKRAAPAGPCRAARLHLPSA